MQPHQESQQSIHSLMKVVAKLNDILNTHPNKAFCLKNILKKLQEAVLTNFLIQSIILQNKNLRSWVADNNITNGYLKAFKLIDYNGGQQ